MRPDTGRTDAFHTAFFRAPIGIAMAITDLQGRFIECNQAYCAMLGYTPQELQALDVITVTHPDDRARNHGLMRQLLDREIPNFVVEKRYLTRDGRTIWCRVHVSVTAEDSGMPGCMLGVAEDITAQREADLQLQRSQQLLRMAGRIARLGGWTYDQASQALVWSDEICEMHGHPPGHRPTVAEGIEHYAPEYRDTIRRTLDRCLSEGQPFDFEAELDRVDGQRLWVRVVGEPIRGADGGITGFRGAMQDITQKRQDQAQLHLLQTCVQRMNDIIVITDAEPVDGHGPRVIYVNEAFEKHTGYRADEVIGKTPRILQGPKSSREVLDRIRQRLKAWEPVREEILNYTKDGRELWLELDIAPVADATGWYTHWIAIERNMTERKRAAEALQEQAALLDKARDAIWVMDLDARISYWNQSAGRILGWQPAEVLGADARALLHPDAAAFERCLQAVRTSGEWVGEIEHRTREGKTLLLESRLTLVRNEADEPRAILAINTDVTEQKLLEQQFLRAQRMESIGTLAGGIAHDLNNILAPILMSIHMLKDAVPDPADQALVRTIEVSARRGADLIRQVLSFARGVEGKRHEVRLADVLRDLEHILNETIPRNIAIQSSLADGLWHIQADPTQLQQVLLNLCVNARDAMPSGGRIRIGAENVQLDEHYAAMNIDARVGPYVKLEVEDNGTGMEPAVLERVFDPFFTTKPLGEGTGLGLATTQAIVKSHGGFIRVYSEPGQGTRFRIYLPADTRASGTRTADAPPAVPRGQGQLVLVVDDEEAIRQVTRQTLEAFGYRVLVAANGAEAVAQFAQHRDGIALVLTDMMMPVMDGPATIQALRQIRADVRIVGASGIGQNGAVARAAGAGVRHFLPKPYTADVLLRTLADALGDPVTTPA